MVKKIFAPFALALACALLLTACGSSDNTTTTNNASATNANKTTTTTSPTTTSSPTTTTSPTTTSSPTTTAAGEKIGVPECDDYLSKLEACLGKLPAAAKAQYEKSLEQNRKAWHDAASTPQGKASLATGCKAATDAIRQPMKGLGCEF